jgi:predicted TIM-barrel fold metal-dependent hydrolase
VAHWSDPAKRTAQSELTRQRMDRRDVRAKISERTKAAHDVPGMRERKLAGLTRAFADPELRRKISAATKAGMAAKAVRELAALKTAWAVAPSTVRRRFMVEIAMTTENLISQGSK